MPSYLLLLYIDLSTQHPYSKGDTIDLHGQTWDIVSVEKPVHPTKDALLVCKSHPSHMDWPAHWRT